MRKIYTLIAGLVLTGSALNAQIQIIKDGGLELGTYYPGSAIGVNSPNVGGTSQNASTIDWVGIMQMETAAPITATKSLVMTSVNDAVAAQAFGGTEPNTSGLAQQTYKGGALAGKTSSDFTMSFKYTYAPSGVDTAFVIVNLLDTNLTGSASIVYQGFGLMLNQPTAALKTVTTWAQGTALTINRAVITFGTSLTNYFDDSPANIGSKLVIDDISFLVTSGVGVEELSATSLVYPNPVLNTLNVEIKNAEATSISIYGLDGSLVKTESLNGVKGEVNVENLNPGMYLYSISTKGGSVIQSKFLKK